MITRRKTLVAMALLIPGARALFAFQNKPAKLATVTLLVDGMT